MTSCSIAICHTFREKTKPAEEFNDFMYNSSIITGWLDYWYAWRVQFGSWRKGARTHEPVCNRGWLAILDYKKYIWAKRCKPSRRALMTLSAYFWVNTFPGRGGSTTVVDSRSRASRSHSKSEYRLRTCEFGANVFRFVLMETRKSTCFDGSRRSCGSETSTSR